MTTITGCLYLVNYFKGGNVGMFYNSYFNNSFGFVRQFKNGLFKLHILEHKKSEIRINRT
jgi:hypothetical protein